MASSDTGIIISLLQKLSDDQAKLREEMTSIREETSTIEKRLCSFYSLQIWDFMSRYKAENSAMIQQCVTHTISSEFTGRLEEVETNLVDSLKFEMNQLSDVVKMERKNLYSNIRHFWETSQRSENPAEFIYFRSLPPELRLKIWKMACFNNPAVFKLRETLDEDQSVLALSGYRVPAVLHTTRESRYESFRWYARVSLDFFTHHPGLHFEGPERIVQVDPKYINFNVDILYLAKDGKWNPSSFHENKTWIDIIAGSEDREVFRMFRRVAIPQFALWPTSRWIEDAPSIIHQRCQIEEIIVVANPDDLREVEQRLVPERYIHGHQDAHHDVPCAGGGFWGYLALEKRKQKITAILERAAASTSGVDGNEDSSSDEDSDSDQEEPGADGVDEDEDSSSDEDSNSGYEGPGAGWKPPLRKDDGTTKSVPEFTIMRLEDVYSTPNATIRMS